MNRTSRVLRTTSDTSLASELAQRTLTDYSISTELSSELRVGTLAYFSIQQEFTRISKAIKSGDTSEKALQSYEETWKKEIDPKIKSAHKVQAKWLKLSDDDWDKEIGIISNLSADEFLDFIRADFTVSKMVKLATHHPMLAVRQFFNIIKGA